MAASEPLYYFAYGSNLALQQMKSRCPSSPFYAFGILKDYKASEAYPWIINSRGYGNVVEMNTIQRSDFFQHLIFGTSTPDRKALMANPDPVPSETEYEVQGLLFTLGTEADEDSLDIAEGVPYAYQKVLRWVEVPEPSGSDAGRSIRKVLALVYVDEKRVEPGKCKEEYVARMNRGIRDAMEKGMDSSYVEKYLRPFVPAAEVPDEVKDPFHEGR
ncbi:hypothetical protein B0O99DRAFT_684128 [Bisporella sp. PMI_857]|nr:hypothetical protein B0O99DRAFT_684128 [Bisporella sp. PMI_857]